MIIRFRKTCRVRGIINSQVTIYGLDLFRKQFQEAFIRTEAAPKNVLTAHSFIDNIKHASMNSYRQLNRDDLFYRLRARPMRPIICVLSTAKMFAVDGLKVNDQRPVEDAAARPEKILLFESILSEWRQLHGPWAANPRARWTLRALQFRRFP